MNNDFKNSQPQKLSNEGSDIIYLSNPSKVLMDDDWFDIASTDHFWIIWRFSLIKRYFDSGSNEKSKILEIGCGNGINMQLFQSQLGLTIDGCDLNEKALKKIKDVRGKKYLYNIFDQSPIMLNKYNLILLLDVIEHIENDKEFIEASLSCLTVNGIVIINLPAFQMLYSTFDKNMGHVMRYNKKQLETLLASMGLQVEYITYWGLLLFPVLLLRKLVLVFVKKNTAKIGFSPPHPMINKAFLFLMKLEKKLFSKPILGTSLFAIAKKVRV